MSTPNFQDQVRNTVSNVTGTVIAKYAEDGVTYFDVRWATEDKVWYHTPAANWETVKGYDDE